MRLKPTLSKWKGYHMANVGTWYFAYTINGNTITIIDACHSLNMVEPQTQPMKPKQQMQYQPTQIVHNGYRLVKANNGLMNFVDGNNKLISNQWFSNYKTYKPFRKIQCICFHKCRWLVYGINLEWQSY